MRRESSCHPLASGFVVAIAVTFVFCSTSNGQLRQRVNQRANQRYIERSNQRSTPSDVKQTSILMRDLGRVTLDSAGNSQITFNPAMCRRLGPELCEFFRMHEVGHVQLRHLERGVPAQQAELEADQYAAQHASPAAVAAARRYFAAGNGGTSLHGTPQQRGQRLNQPLPVAAAEQVIIIHQP